MQLYYSSVEWESLNGFNPKIRLPPSTVVRVCVFTRAIQVQTFRSNGMRAQTPSAEHHLSLSLQAKDSSYLGYFGAKPPLFVCMYSHDIKTNKFLLILNKSLISLKFLKYREYKPLYYRRFKIMSIF